MGWDGMRAASCELRLPKLPMGSRQPLRSDPYLPRIVTYMVFCTLEEASK